MIAAHRARQAGFTIIEAMIMLVVLSIVSLGVSVAMRSSVGLPEAADRAVGVATELNSEIETWRAQAWGPSPWPTSLPFNATDTVTLHIGGQSIIYPRITSIQNWDPQDIPNNSHPQPNFARVRITINGQIMDAYLTSPN